jgi:hypothetical protein
MKVREQVTDAATGETSERWIDLPDVVSEADGIALATDRARADARVERTRRLSDSDWTTKSDVPMSDERRAAWLAYRQALRDVPGQTGFPEAINWPAAP